MTPPIDIFVVRGAPGTGKREAVHQLRAQLIDGAVVDVEVFRSMFARPVVTDRQQHFIAMHIAKGVTLQFVERKVRPVVVVDTFPSGRLSSFVNDLAFSFRIASLFLEPNALRERLSNQGASVRDIESALMINAEVATRRHEQERLIDVTGCDASKAAMALRQWLRFS